MTEFITDFELAWKEFPRKTAKAVARKAWNKLSPDAETVQKILNAIAWQKRQPQWTKDDGQYIPHFSTWLNQERWTDEPPTPSGNHRNDRLQGLRDFVDGGHVH